MAKRKYADPSAPLWCLSYGDMVTNMLCFFVMLLMFATFGAQKRNQQENRALEMAFTPVFSINPEKGAHQWLVAGGKGILLMPNPRHMADIPRIVRRVKNQLQKAQMRDQILVTGDDQGVKIRIPSKVLFMSGSATLKAGSDEVLEALVPVIGELNQFIRIDGHCDDKPTKNSQFPTNWELSSARACAVLRFFTEKIGLDSSRFSAQGFAEFRPQVENITEADRDMNRRVEIMILTTKQRKKDVYRWE
ncbi:MAG TPA: flagellar motor protein MotB [Candidatus Ozemobacteraceae bacterium]|nr:flagellar motor protein MotB [Candidatus Ozemobacteraceae bacterium]